MSSVSAIARPAPGQARMEPAEHGRAGEGAGQRGESVDLALANVDEDGAGAHAGDRPAHAKEQTPDHVAGVARLRLDGDRLSAYGPAVPLEQPQARCGERDRGADDAVELKALEEEHALDVVVV